MSAAVKSILPPPFDWCEIPAGKVTLRAKRSRPKASDAIYVPAFYIAKYPVTNAQYKLFVDAGGYHQPQWWLPEGWKAREENLIWDSGSFKPAGFPWTEPYHWQDARYNGADQPVTSVSWYEAMAFCVWLSEISGEKITLPTIEQWQRAAQGDDKRAYPWGRSWDADRCNNNVDGTKTRTGTSTPVQHYEGKGDSPFGVVDMAGNTYEWCLTERYSDNKRSWRVTGGHSWQSTGLRSYRIDQHYDWQADQRGFMQGFRIARLSGG